MNYPVGKRTKVKGQVGLYIYRGKGLADGKPKLCYYFTHSNGRFVKVGWNWEGYNLEKAKAVRDDFIQKLRHGDTLPSKENQILFSEAWKRYKAYAEDINATSLKFDTSRWNAAVKRALGNKPVNSIRSTDIERLLGKLEKMGRTRATRLGYLSMIRRVYRHLQDENITKHDPSARVRVRGTSQLKKRYLTRDEIAAILRLIGDDWELRTQVLLGVEMGLRRSEMFTYKKQMTSSGRDYSLRWDQINFDTNTIHLRGKGHKGRAAFITENVKEALLKLGPKKNGKVFHRLRWGKFNRIVNDLKLNQGIDYYTEEGRSNWVSMHTLRHTFASYAVLLTKDLFLVAKLLGHNDVQTTQRYAHLLEGEQKGAMDKIGAFFDRTQNDKSNVIHLHPRRQ